MIRPSFAFPIILSFIILTFILDITAPLALIIGIFLSQVTDSSIRARFSNYTSLILKIGIVGLGFGLSLSNALAVSKDGFVLTISTIAGVLLLGYALTRFMKLDTKIGSLISTGTAICGGSAIAAVAPIIEADKNQIGISLGIVFLLNAFALILFPFLGELLQMSQYQFGLWAAIAIHDTSSVVGAAAVFGDEALEIATTVKLARALWIIPLSVLFGVIYGFKKKVKVPYFILLFIAAILINHFFSIPVDISNTIGYLSKNLMVIAIFFVGLGFSKEAVLSIGKPVVILSLALWISVSVISAFWIMNLL